MSLSENLLIGLESAHFGRLSSSEEAELKAVLEGEPEKQKEANVYKKIWQGFDALKRQQQSQLFQKWEQELNVHDEIELIEWYVNDELGEETTKRLNERSKNDAEFAAKVDSFKNIKGGFDSLKARNFRTKMDTWEATQAEKVAVNKPVALSVSWKRPLSIAASILFLITASFSWWNHQEVSNTALFATYHIAPMGATTLGSENSIDAYLLDFEEAEKLMKPDYNPDAIKAFEVLKEQNQPTEWPASERKHYTEIIEWHLVLALLADGQTDTNFDQKLDRITNNDGHEYQHNAIELKEKLASFWRF